MNELALIARARGVATHLLTRQALEQLHESADPREIVARERDITRKAHAALQLLWRWQQRTPGVLDIFAAHQDRRSLRALLRGAVTGAPADARVDGLLPTPTLPALVLSTLAQQPSARDVVRHLVIAAHPDARRLLPLVGSAQPDLLALDEALLRGFEERATRAAARADDVARQFVLDVIDLGKRQTALLAGGKAVAHLDRDFLDSAIARLTRLARVEPLSTAPLLRVLLLVEAQARDLRALAWGAVLGTPAPRLREDLVTPP